MPNFLQLLANNVQYLLLFIVFVVPMIGGVIRWMETQREKRRRQAALERRRLEALRTGRSEAEQPMPVVASARTSREEAAARRQREMQDRLRERLEQQRRASQSTTVQAPPQTARQSPGQTARQIPRPIPGQPPRQASPRPGAPTRVPQRAPAPPPTRPPQTTARQTGSQPGRPFPQQQQRPTRNQPRPARSAPVISARPQQVPVAKSLRSTLEAADAVAREEIGSAREAASLQADGPAVRIGPGLSMQRLRDAVVLREVLSPPIALRPPGSDIHT